MAVSKKSTQDVVPIKEIRDDVVILKDGSARMILMASSLNFALKSEDEQNALIFQYQNFLNSLDFSIQFFISSRLLDINPYINILNETEKEQSNELLKIQIKEYVEFIKNFVKSTNIVTKSFYVVIPYSTSAISTSGGNPFKDLTGSFSKKSQNLKSDVDFGEIKMQLQQRAMVVQDGLIRIGIRSIIINTEELIELYYKLFNPEEPQGGKVLSQRIGAGQ